MGIVQPGPYYRTVGAEVISSLSAAVGFTASELAGDNVSFALCQPSGGAIRCWDSGDTPTADEGHYFKDKESFKVVGSDGLKNFLAIDSGGTAKLMVSYYGEG